MSASKPLPRLPYVLLGAMTLASFGGPFAILGVLWGGESSRWPPDRPVEWAVLVGVFALVFTLFVACVTIRQWYAVPVPRGEAGPGPPGTGSDNQS